METSYSLIPTNPHMKLLLLYRRSLPKSEIIFIAITCTKFIPILLFTHAIPSNTSINILTLSKITRAFITFKSTTINIQYNTICAIVYIISIFIVINALAFITLFKHKAKITDQIVYQIPNNNITITKTMQIVIKIAIYITLIYMLLYQNIMEILYKEIFIYILSIITPLKYAFGEYTLRTFEQFKNIYILILNILFFIISFIMIFCFHSLTQMKTLTRTYGFKSPLGKASTFISVVMFSLQGSYSSMYNTNSSSTYSNTYNSYYIIFTYFYVCLLFINSLLNINYIQQNNNDTVHSVFFHLNNFCFISGLLEVIIYHTLPSKIHNQTFYITLLITDIVITITYNWILKSICYKKFIRRFISSFFSMTKHNKVYDYYNYFNYIQSFRNDISSQFTFIYSLYLHHINICNEDSCQCHLITNKHFTINTSELQILIEYFAMIVEHKMSNEILAYTFKEGNTSSNLGDLLVTHVDYLFSVKNNIPLTLYLCQFYLMQYKKELSFQEAYTIYEINYIVYMKYKETQDVNKNQVSFIKKNIIREKIEKIIMRICISFEKFFYYKSAKNNNSKIFFTCEDVLTVFDEFIREKKLLVNLINESMQIDLFQNLKELKMMLLYFTSIVRIKLPKTRNTNHIRDNYSYNSNDVPLKDINFNNNNNNNSSYMILYLKTDNKFIIRYASPEILNVLSYKKKEIINMDFNSLLILPSISEYHAIYMKQFVLYGYYTYVKKTFLLNKQQKLVPIIVKIKVLPTRSTLANLVLEIIFKDTITFDQHFLILDSSYQVSNISKSVESRFMFTLDMLKSVKFNFCDFFGINKDKLMDTFEHYLISYTKDSNLLTDKQATKKNTKLKTIMSRKNNTNNNNNDTNNNNTNNNKNNNENNISYYHGNNKHDILALPSVKKDEIYFYHDIDFRYFKHHHHHHKQNKQFTRPIYQFNYKHNQNNSYSNSQLHSHQTFIPPTKTISYNELVNTSKIVSSIIRMVKNINELGLEKEWKERLELLYFKLTSINLTDTHFKQEQHHHHRFNTLASLTIEKTPRHHQDNINIHSNTMFANLTIPKDYFHISFHLKTIAHFYYIIMTISEPKKENLVHIEISEEPFSNIHCDNHNNNNIHKDITSLNILPSPTNNEQHSSQRLLRSTPKQQKVQFNPEAIINNDDTNNGDNGLRSINRDTSEMMLTPSDFLGNSVSINLSQAQLIKSTQTRKKTFNDYKRSNTKQLEQLKQELPELFSKQNFNGQNYNFKYSQTSSKTSNVYSLYTNGSNLNKTIIFEKLVRYGKTIVLISILVVTILNIINLILSNHLTQFSLNLFHINAYTCLIANDIYYGSLLALTTCLHDEGFQETNLSNLNEKILQSSNDLINHYHQLTSYLNLLINKQEIVALFLILNQKDQYKYILPNWEKAFRESSLSDELYSIHFYLKQYNAIQTERYCRVRSIFIDKNKTGLTPTQEEEFIYYIIGNTVGTISDLIEKLMKEVNKLLMKNNDSTNTKTLLIKIVILVIVVVLFIMDILILKALSFIFLQNILCIFSPLKNENVFFDEIKKFKNILINSESHDNKRFLRNKPIKLFYSDMNHNIGSSSISFNSSVIKSTKRFANKYNNNTKYKTSKKKEYTKVYSRQNEYTKIHSKKNLFDLNSTTINNNTNSNNHITNTTEDDDDENSQKGGNNFLSVIQPKIFVLFIVLISIVYIVYLFIEIISIYITSSENKGLSIENQFATNFLNRVPKIYELILYSITSVFMDSINYITKPQDIYDDYILSNEYGITLNLESNSFFALFHESNYAYLYYQLHIIRQNLLRFINDRTMDKYLHETTLSEFKFNEGELFCIYAPLEYVVNYYTHLNDHTELISYLTKETKKCRTVGKGINLSGYASANDLILELLTTLYHTFKTGELENRQEIFLKSKDLFLIIDDAINVLRILHFADAFSSIEDVKNTYKRVKNYTAIFSVLLIIFNVFVISGVSLITLVVFLKTISITKETLNDFYISVQKCKN